MNEEQLRETLRRCPPETIDAAIKFNLDRDPAHLPVIVLGIIERFVEPDVRPKVREGDNSTRLLEDLGIDSLLMVEIVMMVEEVLDIRTENEELRNLRTIGDIKSYLDMKIRGIEPSEQRKGLGFEDIAAVMPHQPPFLFLQDAHIDGDHAEGSYRITGDEAFLEGHFKDEPIFPASIMLEALGQLAVLYLLKAAKPELSTGSAVAKAYFVSADGVRCHRMCHPGDTLKMKVTMRNLRDPLATFSGVIKVNDEKTVVVEEMTLAYGDPKLASQSSESGQAPHDAVTGA